MDVWKKFKFSVDLIGNSIKEILFLKEINDSPIASNDELISRAVYRYEKIWLPFYSRNESSQLSPPLDVEWIWHCHMLSHNQYKEDCLQLYGKILDHQVLSCQERIQRENDTYLIWSKTTHVSFNYLDPKSVDSNYSNFKSNLRVNLKELAKRQLDFFYHVSLPHFQKKEYLILGLDRYEKFLYLKKRNPSVYIIPCYAIYLIWHTHQQTPLAFANDTNKIFGRLFSPRDSVNKIDYWVKVTKNLWEKTFGEEFFFPGGMSRSSSIPKQMSQIKYFDTFENLCCKYFKCEIKDLRMETNLVPNSYLIRLCLNFDDPTKDWLTNIWRPVFKKNSVNSKSVLAKLEDNQNRFKKLNLDVAVFNDSNTVNKFLNVFRTTQRSISNALAAHSCSFDLVNLNEPIKLIKIVKNEFNLSLRVLLERIQQDKICFGLTKNEFTNVRMNQIKYEYTLFDLHKKTFKSNEESGMRAIHQIWTNKGYEIKKDSFELEVLHIFATKWGSLKLLANKQTVAMSHLIGLEHLPGLYQLPEETYTYEQNELCESSIGIILDNRYEKAMLIRNIYDGDYAIIKGKWIGKKNIAPGATGRLIINLYLLSSKKMQKIRISNRFTFNISSENIKAQVNIKTGLIQFKQMKNRNIKNLEVESLLVCVYSVAMLHVVLQPRLNDHKVGSIGWNTIESYLMLNSIANYTFLRSTRFNCGLSGFDGCDTGFDSENGNEYVGSVYGRGLDSSI